MYWNRRFLRGVLVLMACPPGLASIIDDKSDFVGDYTVIDFESWGDGTPLVLEEGDFTEVFSDEYAAFGLTMSSSRNIFGNDRPFIANGISHPQADTAHETVGSTPNYLFVSGSEGFLRFDFHVPVNAIGLSVMNWTDGEPVRLEVYDVTDELIQAVDFDLTVIDGIIPGSDFGNPFDIQYGFIGVFAPRSELSYAIVREDRTIFDDVHFGVIPEPATVTLLVLGALAVTARRKHRTRQGWIIIGLPALVVAGYVSVAHAGDVTGTVSAWVMLTEDPICGDDAPPGCIQDDQEDLSKVALEGVHLFIEDGAFTFTDANGEYTLTYDGSDPVTVYVDLNGEGAKVGELLGSPPDFYVGTTQALDTTFVPPPPPESVEVNFVFNAHPDPGNRHPAPEAETAEATAYYHIMFVRHFYVERYPEFTGLDGQLGVAVNDDYAWCISPGYAPDGVDGPYLLFQGSFYLDCPECCYVNQANRALLAHWYGWFIQDQLGLGIGENGFTYGFGNALALLVYDYPILAPGYSGPGTYASNYNFGDLPDDLQGQRRMYPCDGPPCNGDAVCCADILAGIWWDIKKNMQRKYNPPEQTPPVPTPDCPIDPNLTGTAECGLEITRQLFVDWSRNTDGQIDKTLPLDLLRTDDDDHDLWNGTPHYPEICPRASCTGRGESWGSGLSGGRRHA